VPEINAVIPPQIAIKNKILGEYSKIKEKRTNKKTPAVTMVAAWIKAETGVGPSIASGSHVCNPICADFPTAPRNKKIVTSSSISVETKGAKTDSTEKSIE
jgi:hypothetical protein